MGYTVYVTNKLLNESVVVCRADEGSPQRVFVEETLIVFPVKKLEIKAITTDTQKAYLDVYPQFPLKESSKVENLWVVYFDLNLEKTGILTLTSSPVNVTVGTNEPLAIHAKSRPNVENTGAVRQKKNENTIRC